MASRPAKDVSTSKWTCLCGCGGKVAPGASFVHGHNLAFKHASPEVKAQVEDNMAQRRKAKHQEVPPPMRSAERKVVDEVLEQHAPKKATITFTQTDPPPSPAEASAAQVDMPVPRPRVRRTAAPARLVGRADPIPAAAVPALGEIKTGADSRNLPAAQEATAMQQAAAAAAASATRGKGTRRLKDLSDQERTAIIASGDSYRAIGERYNITKDVVAAVKRAAGVGKG